MNPKRTPYLFGPVMAAIFRLEDQGFRLSDIRVLREVSRGLKKQCKREPPNLKMRVAQALNYGIKGGVLLKTSGRMRMTVGPKALKRLELNRPQVVPSRRKKKTTKKKQCKSVKSKREKPKNVKKSWKSYFSFATKKITGDPNKKKCACKRKNTEKAEKEEKKDTKQSQTKQDSKTDVKNKDTCKQDDHKQSDHEKSKSQLEKPTDEVVLPPQRSRSRRHLSRKKSSAVKTGVLSGRVSKTVHPRKSKSTHRNQNTSSTIEVGDEESPDDKTVVLDNFHNGRKKNCFVKMTFTLCNHMYIQMKIIKT